MMGTWKPTLFALAFAVSLGACSSSHGGDGPDDSPGDDGSRLDLGPRADLGPLPDGSRPDDPFDRIRDGGGASTDSGWTPPPGDMAPAGDRAGNTWDGYVESYSFPSGSDRVRIIFDSATGDGPRTGVVIFGEGSPPPPATDPTIGYPAGAGEGYRQEIWEGYEYPIVEGSVSGARVQVAVDLGHLYEDWCRLQMPIPQDDSGMWWGCLPNTGGGSGPSGCFYNDPDTDEPIGVDCGKFELCFGARVCECDATRCEASTGQRIEFDFRVDGDDAAGSVQLRDLHNVYVTRSP